MRRKPSLFVLFSLIISASLLASCAGSSSTSKNHKYAMADMAGMPTEVQDSPVTVQQAYQFAAANPEILTKIPCYCGCAAVGHTSNYDCYIDEVDGQGQISYDTHALGCSICVDITQDTMRLLDQGKSVAEIRSYIDSTYASYGPSNMGPSNLP